MNKNRIQKTKSTRRVIFFETLARYSFQGSGIFIIVLLMLIVLFLFRESLPFFLEENLGDFFFGTKWRPDSSVKELYGIVPLVISTFFVMVGAMAISIPIGLGAAIFFSEYVKGKTAETLKYTMEVLSSIPSVVIGFIGLVLTGPFVARLTGQTNGLNALNGSILVSLMALPTIIGISTDSIREVPKSLREASLGMGASKWETIVKVVLPKAKSGIMASFMLGVGRAIGETMTVLMATGNGTAIPTSFFDSVRTMTATIAIEMGEVPFGSKHFHALFSIGLVLFAISFVVNMIADFMIHRSKV